MTKADVKPNFTNLEPIINILRILSMLKKALNRVARRNYHDRSQYPEVFFEIETSLNGVCAWIKNFKYFCNFKISIAMLGLHIEKIGQFIKRLTMCLQCHRASDYDTTQHHFHKKKGEKGDPIKSADGKVLSEVGTGAECVQCHMPGRYYMGVHYRLDHSIRIPRPDLGVKIGVPEACTRCHLDKTKRWSDEAITKWYGPGCRAHYGEIIQAGRNQQPGAAEGLIRLAGDPLYPVIVRATSLELLDAYPCAGAGADGR